MFSNPLNHILSRIRLLFEMSIWIPVFLKWLPDLCYLIFSSKNSPDPRYIFLGYTGYIILEISKINYDKIQFYKRNRSGISASCGVTVMMAFIKSVSY